MPQMKNEEKLGYILSLLNSANPVETKTKRVLVGEALRMLGITGSQLRAGDTGEILTSVEAIKLWKDLQAVVDVTKDLRSGDNSRYGENPILVSWIARLKGIIANEAMREFETQRRNVGAPKSVDTPEKLANWIKIHTEEHRYSPDKEPIA